MNNRIVRGILLGAFSLLVFIASSAPAYAAYTQIADLTVWNNANSNTSGAHVTVEYDATAKLVRVTLLGDPAGAPPGSPQENDIDQFYWNGTAILTLVGWAGTPSGGEVNNGGHADGFCCFAKEITSTKNGTGTNGFDARVLIFSTDGGTFLPCFAAHVIEERSGANAYVSGTCAAVTTPEPASLLLLGPGLLLLGFARKRLSGWKA